MIATAALLERDTEVERLSKRLDAALEGQGATLAVEGDAGIGKSALLAETARLAAERGMGVLRARGGELEREFAFGVVRQLLERTLARATASERERMLNGAARLAAPALSLGRAASPAGMDSTQAVLHGLYWLSANLAQERPLVMAIDDAHWADPASLRFIAYVARRADELPLLMLYAARPAEGVSDALPAVAEPDTIAEVLRPAPLSEAAAGELVRNVRGDASSAELARACHTATGGNPFLLRELLRAIEEDKDFQGDAAAERIVRLAPRAISRSILARLRRLGPDATRLAFSIAVLGASAELRHATEHAELGWEAAASAADALAAAGIVRARHPLEFVHPVVRSVVYAEIPAAPRDAAHKRAARLLGADGTPPEALAPHLLAGEPARDGWVVRTLRAAAEAALAGGAPDTACGYLERALAEPPPPEERAGVLHELGAAELRAGRAGASEHLRAALDDAHDDATRAAAVGEMALALTAESRTAEALEIVGPVIAQLARTDRESAMRLEAELIGAAHVGLATARVARERLDPYRGRLSGASPGERMLLGSQAFSASFHDGSADEAAGLAEPALAGGRLLGEQRPDSHAFYQAVLTLVFADRLARAEEMLDLAIADARSRGSLMGFSIATSARSHVLLREGRLAEAEADGRAALAAAQRAWRVGMAAVVAYLLDAMVERAELDECEAVLEDTQLTGDVPPMTMANPLLYSRAQLRLTTGEPGRALADLEELIDREERHDFGNPAAWPVHATAALALMMRGEREAARVQAHDGLVRARRWGAPSTIAFALRAAGVATGGAEGIEMLREAATTVERSPARYERALCLTELGATLRRAGHRRDAREPLRAGLDLAHRGGARRLARRAREELVAAGARPRRIALSGLESLTGGERRVSQLAADGLSNREIAQALFVTVRTVEMHLTHAYAKLGISSREELPAVLAPDAAGPADPAAPGGR